MRRELMGGRYRLERVLREGSTATVYEAWDTRLKRAVSVKMLAGQRGLSAAQRERFLAEARALARFKHPNVV
ncbi:MAG: protein kinase, partial [Ardenticatenaceae bacterium]